MSGMLKLYDSLVDLINPNFTEGPYFIGGFPMRLYCGYNVDCSDIDIFTTNEQQYQDIVRELCRLSIDNCYSSTWQSDNATTFRFTSYTPNENDNKFVQVIKPNRGKDLSDILNAFDIRACKIATDGKSFVFSRGAEQDAKAKKAVFTLHNENTLKRVIKYSAYGFEIDKKTLQYVYDNLNDPNVFKRGSNDGY